MALTPLQRDVSRLLAESRKASGESYVAGGAASILEHAGRTGRYAPAELSSLAFEGAPPEGAALAARWRAQLDEARRVVERLPADEVGRAVLLGDGALYTGSGSELPADLAAGRVSFHPGRLRGAFPTIRG
jgi:hypothetical protein